MVELESLSMSFATRDVDVRALDGVDLSVREGEFVALIGPSGCGKSTLLKLAAGLLMPSAGRVLIGGEAVEKPRTDIGMMFQVPVLLPWKSVLGNVMLQADLRGLPRSEFRQRSRRLLSAVGLAGYEKRYVFELSGGMQQRVSFCRAVLHEPSILLMDEPFGALDALTREQVALDLQQMWMTAGGQTVLFVTHSITEAALLADRVVVFSPAPGRIQQIVHVELERPRGKDVLGTPKFAELTTHLRDLIDAGT